MPLIGFTVHRDKIENKSKRQTIRKLRKKPIKKGDKLYLYWNLRRKDCALLHVKRCIDTFFVKMHFHDNWLGRGKPIWRIDESSCPKFFRRQLTARECEDLADREGFTDTYEMLKWFRKTHGDLTGKQVFQVIRW